MIQFLRYACARFLNTILPKEANSIFAEPHRNGKAERQDLINYAGDSVLSFINYLYLNGYAAKYKIYLAVYHMDRMEILEKYLAEKQITNIVLVPHFVCFSGWKARIQKIRYEIRKMRTRVWLCATVHANKKHAVSSQKLVNLGYFSSFKSDYNDVPFDYLPKKWALVCSTSKMDSAVQSAAFAIPFECFQPLGLARNDYLFQRSAKEEIIRNWIFKKTGKSFSKIIIFAPTFRDYEKDSSQKRNLWGYEDCANINRVLEENDAIVIAKMHSWQNMGVISGESDRVILYEPSFEYTIYDLMTMADLLITDYSSIGLDFLLTNKPVIYNLYDRAKYLETRGMCSEPIEEICGGEIVEDEESLADCMRRCLIPGYEYKEMQRVQSLYFKYKDGNSCERIYEFLREKEVL